MSDPITPASSVHSMASLMTYGHENSDDEHEIQPATKKEFPEFTKPISKSPQLSNTASPYKIFEKTKEEKPNIDVVKKERLDEAQFTIGDPFSDEEAGHVESPMSEQSPADTKISIAEVAQPPPPKRPRNTGDVILVSYDMHDDDDEEGSHSHRKMSSSRSPGENGMAQPEDDDMDVVASDQEEEVQPEIEVKEEISKQASPDTTDKTEIENKYSKINTKLEHELEKKRREDSMEASSLSRVMRTMKPEDICIPREPPGQCSKELQDRVREYVKRARYTDFDLNKQIQDRKDFRNSSIYEKLVTYLDIDEKGTNFPMDVYDPYRWGPESFYEELAKSQNKEIEKREKEKKEQRKVEFVSATKTSSTSANNLQKAESEPKKRTKWDTKPPLGTAVSAQSLPTDTQPSGKPATIIPAVGTLTKKKTEK